MGDLPQSGNLTEEQVDIIKNYPATCIFIVKNVNQEGAPTNISMDCDYITYSSTTGEVIGASYMSNRLYGNIYLYINISLSAIAQTNGTM